jgi:DeoR/GlpR family transcriptional regulator of sugar metabolism
MSSSFWLLRVESRDFSQAEKERIARKAVQIHKMMTIFTQNGPMLSF